MKYFLNLLKNYFFILFALVITKAYTYEVYRSTNLDPKTMKYVGDCDPVPDDKLIFKTDKATQSVMLRVTGINGSFPTEPHFLDGCKVIDDNNWSCESTSQMPTFIIYWSTYKVMDGKMYSSPTYKIFNNSFEKIYPGGKNEKSCWFNKSAFGYKRQ
jgi:hypothetical protein